MYYFIAFMVLLNIMAFAFMFVFNHRRKRAERELARMKAEYDMAREKAGAVEQQLTEERKMTEMLMRKVSVRADITELQTYKTLAAKTAALPVVKSYAEYGELALTNGELAAMVAEVDGAFGNFSVRLKKAYPTLRKHDIHCCCLTMMRFDTQTIKAFLGSTYRTETRRGEKLKQVFGTDSLFEFLMEFANNCEEKTIQQ